MGVDADARRPLPLRWCAALGQGVDLCLEFRRLVRQQCLGDQLFERVALWPLGQAAGSGVHDEERVEDDPVAPREDACAQDVQPRRGQGPGDGGEQPRAIPRADFYRGVAARRLIVPGDDRLEHPGAGAVDDALEEAGHLCEVDVDMLKRVGAEVTRREVFEVGLEFLARNFQRQQRICHFA